ncbi:MAG: TolC family protein, partial [Phycisphaeraceae bacterium]
RLRARATAAEYRTAALTLAAEVARTWYRLAEAQRQLDILQQQIDTNESVVELLEDRFAAGQIRSADVLRQRQLVEATREQAVLARSRQARLQHQLAVLMGRPPQAEPPNPRGELPEIPPPPAVGLPAELVERRPDVRQARLRLEAADRDLASAIADRYPRINLTASLSSTAEDPGGLFENWLASLTGQLVAPLFDAGQRRAEVNRAEAVTRQRVAEYGQSVLTAFREVEDALAAEQFDAQRIDRLEEQLRLSRQTLEQLRTQYLNGVTDYIAVLTALTQQQRLQRDLVASRLARLDSRIELYRALAGPFDTPRERAANADSRTTDPRIDDSAAAEHDASTHEENPHE